MLRRLRLGVVVVILAAAVLWLGNRLGAGSGPTPPEPATSEPGAAAVGLPAEAPSSGPSVVPTVAPPTTETMPRAAPQTTPIASPSVAIPTAPPASLQVVLAPLIPTVFVVPAGTQETIRWPASAGASFQCQWSIDLAAWNGFPVTTVDADGMARCSVVPQETAYYRSLFLATGTYGETVRGVVTQKPGWAGYLAQSGPFTRVTGSFTVPTIAPSPQRTDVAEWVGIGGYAAGDQLIQAGAWETYDPASGATPDVYAWWELWPATVAQRVPLPVSEGDTVTVTVWQEPSGRWAIEIVDRRWGSPYAAETTYTGAAASAEWIVEAPIDAVTGAQLTLADFARPVSFSQIGFTGSDANTLQLWTYSLTSGAKRTVPSALSSDGRAFHVTDLGGNSGQ